jgi:hypothetical protein
MRYSPSYVMKILNYVKEQAKEQIREEQLRLWKDDSE